MQVTLPGMGESVTEGTIAKWLKQPGDQVREGEGLVEVTTDKVDAEVPAPASGTLIKILAEAGKTVAVGAALAEIAVGADADGAAKKAPTVSSAPNGEEKKAPTLAAPEGAAEKETSTAQVEVTEGAELLAKAKGIDLATIKGSGPGGSIRRRDVAEAVERQQAPTLPSPRGGGEKPASPTSDGGEKAGSVATEEGKQAATLPSPRGGGEKAG